MAQFYFQPLAEDEGNAPSNITFTVMAPDGATPGTNVVQQFDGDLAWILDLDNATNWLLRIDSIDGVAIPDSADTEIYIEMSPQGASSDFGVAARITETSPGDFDAYGLLASRGTDDWSLRRFNDSSIRRTFGTGLGGDSFPGTEQFWRQRFRVNGDPDPTVSGSLWDPANPEPTDWEVQAQDTSDDQITGTGFSAIARRITNSSFGETRIRGIGIGTDGDPAPTEPVDTGEQFITASQRASFALDTRAPELQSGTSLTATRAEIALNTIAGTTRAGYSETGAVSQIALSSAPGTAQAGAAVEAVPLSLQLSARPGTVITGDAVPVVIQAARADLSLSTQSGDVIRGHAIEGGAIAFSIEPHPGTVQTADAVPFVVTGATADLSLSTESGDIEAGALLEGATVMLSLDPDNPDIVRGHVIDGSPALFELLANAGDVFTGLVFATPITRTRAVDISPRYNVNIMTPRYSVRTIN